MPPFNRADKINLPKNIITPARRLTIKQTYKESR